MIGQIVTVTIDRPKGSRHPKYPDMIYPINYGYVDGIMAPDGEMQDCYIVGIDCPLETFTGKVIAIVHRKDDVEDKWVVSDRDYPIIFIQKQIEFTEQYFDSTIVKK